MTNLNTLLAIRAQIMERLLAQYPELKEDQDALLDTLEGLSDFNDYLIEIFESSRTDLFSVEAIGYRITELKERQERLLAREKAKRSLIGWAMGEAGLKKIEAPSVTLSLRNVPPSVQITDEALIPPSLVKVKEVRSPDKAAIKERLEAGDVIPGAELSNGSVTLSARTK